MTWQAKKENKKKLYVERKKKENMVKGIIAIPHIYKNDMIQVLKEKVTNPR